MPTHDPEVRKAINARYYQNSKVRKAEDKAQHDHERDFGF